MMLRVPQRCHPRRRHHGTSSTFTHVSVPLKGDAESAVPLPAGHEDESVPEPIWYPGGPIDASLLTWYEDHEARRIWDGDDRDPQRFYNHGRKIAGLAQPNELWFQDVLAASCLKDLCQVGYTMIHNGMLMAFAERWNSETSSFHLPHGEITIILDDVACLRHLPIRGTLLGQGWMTKEQAMKMLITELGCDLNDALEEVERTRGAHAAGDEVEANIHRERALRCLWKTRTMAGSYTLLVGEVSTYTELMPRPSRFSPRRGNQEPLLYRRVLDRIAVEDVRYDCYAEYWKTIPFDEIELYSRLLAANLAILVCYLLERVMRQFGYAQTIPRDPIVSAPITMTRRQLDEVFADWEHHMVPEEARTKRAESD
ncbi:uncharacterized protein LOC131648547 [Vicia villosa]|uniref:uncharacterized protein LOC131648547 n=1 Tax=Vicia villosa TaxID=3911 RepID=UPI00273B8044|nr:uncharacterized protein LOC131648547 [Vicia villosa]